MFEQSLAAWQNCYLAISAAGATLAGLLFVALSMHVQTLKDAKTANVRRLAEHTFRDFVRCLMASLFLLIPRFDPSSLAWVSIMLGLSGGFFVAKTLFNTMRDKVAVHHSRYVAKRVKISLIGDAFFIYAGIVILLGWKSVDLGLMLFAAMVILLLTSTRNAWFILVHELG